MPMPHVPWFPIAVCACRCRSRRAWLQQGRATDEGERIRGHQSPRDRFFPTHRRGLPAQLQPPSSG
eukprot:6095322-Pleurochrysis_carterae.AAC.1